MSFRCVGAAPVPALSPVASSKSGHEEEESEEAESVDSEEEQDQFPTAADQVWLVKWLCATASSA